MPPKLRLSSFQIGSPAKRGQGFRIGVTRRPPQGIPKKKWLSDGYFDLWLPCLAPSRNLLARGKKLDFSDPAMRKRFFDSYERELARNADIRQTLALLAEMARRMPISIGCYCADESRCHRSRLLKLIRRLLK